MNTYLNTKNEADCYGCLACMYSCPTGSITLSNRFDKFSYPDFDSAKCIDCGICRSVCPNDSGRLNKMLSTYALKHNDKDVLLNSSSGGAFTAFSDLFIDEGNVVYGACFDEDFYVCHKSASTKAERDKMRSSKYVESSLIGVFPDIKNRLENGEKVLFVGTPCQVSGLNLFLKKEYCNLLTIDLICNGVFSPKIFEDYLKLAANNGEINDFKFRTKPQGKWTKDFRVSIDTSDINPKYKDGFYYLYTYREFGSRPSCSECRFTSTERPGDITIGDFWNLRSFDKSFDCSGGASFVSVNTKKGEEFFKKIKNCTIKKTDIELSVKDIPRLHTPKSKSVIDNKFWKYYKTHSSKKTFDIYATDSLYSKIRRKPFELLYSLLNR